MKKHKKYRMSYNYMISVHTIFGIRRYAFSHFRLENSQLLYQLLHIYKMYKIYTLKH